MQSQNPDRYIENSSLNQTAFLRSERQTGIREGLSANGIGAYPGGAESHRNKPRTLSVHAKEEKTLRAWRDRCYELERQHDSMVQKEKEQVEEIRKLRVQLQSQNKDLEFSKKMRVQVDKLSRERDRAHADLAASKRLITKLEARVGTAHNTNNVSTISAQPSRATGVGGGLKGQLHLLKEENDRLDAEVREKQNVIHQHERQIQMLTQALDIRAGELGLQGDLKGVVLYDLSRAQEEKKHLCLEIGKKNELINQLQAEVDDLSRRVEQLMFVRDSQIDEIGQLKRELSETQAERSQLQSRADDLEAENESLSARAEDIERKNSELVSKVRGLEQELQELSNKMRTEVEDLSAKLAVAKEDYDLLRADSDAQAVGRSQRISWLEERYQGIVKVQKVTEEGLRAEKEKSHALEGEKSELVTRVETEAHRADLLQRDYNGIASELHRVRSQFAALQEDGASLARANQELTSKISMLEDTSTRTSRQLESQVEELRSQLSEAHVRCAGLERRLQEEVDRVGTVRETMEDERSMLSHQVEDLRERVSHLSSALDDANARAEKFHAQVQELEGERAENKRSFARTEEKLKQAVDVAEDEAHQKTIQISSLKNEKERIELRLKAEQKRNSELSRRLRERASDTLAAMSSLSTLHHHMTPSPSRSPSRSRSRSPSPIDPAPQGAQRGTMPSRASQSPRAPPASNERARDDDVRGPREAARRNGMEYSSHQRNGARPDFREQAGSRPPVPPSHHRTGPTSSSVPPYSSHAPSNHSGEDIVGNSVILQGAVPGRRHDGRTGAQTGAFSETDHTHALRQQAHHGSTDITEDASAALPSQSAHYTLEDVVEEYEGIGPVGHLQPHSYHSDHTFSRTEAHSYTREGSHPPPHAASRAPDVYRETVRGAHEGKAAGGINEATPLRTSEDGLSSVSLGMGEFEEIGSAFLNETVENQMQRRAVSLAEIEAQIQRERRDTPS
eukprot:Rmarinus@m.24812